MNELEEQPEKLLGLFNKYWRYYLNIAKMEKRIDARLKGIGKKTPQKAALTSMQRRRLAKMKNV